MQLHFILIDRAPPPSWLSLAKLLSKLAPDLLFAVPLSLHDAMPALTLSRCFISSGPRMIFGVPFLTAAGVPFLTAAVHAAQWQRCEGLPRALEVLQAAGHS